MPRDLREAARCAVGRVYVHPVSKELVVFTSMDHELLLEWRQVTGNNRGRAYASTVFKDDGRWAEFRTDNTNALLPYAYRS